MDVSKFIKTVKKYPVLYDKNLEGFRNSKAKLKAWNNISKEMNKTRDYLRLKWKGLTDTYKKYKKKTYITSLRYKPGKWIWATDLEFLDPYLQLEQNKATSPLQSPSTSNATRVSVDEGAIDSQSASALLQPISYTSLVKHEDDDMETSELLQSEDTPDPLTSTYRKISLRSAQLSGIANSSAMIQQSNLTAGTVDAILNIMNRQTESTDAVDLLFHSYAATFKKFTLKRQALLKVQLAKLFCDAEIEEINSQDYNNLS